MHDPSTGPVGHVVQPNEHPAAAAALFLASKSVASGLPACATKTLQPQPSVVLD